MGILGKWHTVCQFDSLELVAQFLVASVPPPEILLGFDFLRKCGVVVDLGFETLELAAICDPLYRFFFQYLVQGKTTTICLKCIRLTWVKQSW